MDDFWTCVYLKSNSQMCRSFKRNSATSVELFTFFHLEMSRAFPAAVTRLVPDPVEVVDRITLVRLGLMK